MLTGLQRMLAAIIVGVQVVLGATFAISGTSKLVASQGFLVALESSGISKRIAQNVGSLLPVTELTVANLLLLTTGLLLQLVLGITALVIISFAAWTVHVLRRRVNISCGCFGPTGKTVSASTLVRNLVLLAVVGVGFVASTEHGEILHHFGRATVPSVIGLEAIVILLTAFASVRRDLVLSRGEGQRGLVA